jgi:translation initiation factor eIF-2B subunit delta
MHGIPTTYALISALGTVLSSVNLVLLGAHALLSDGGIFSRAGTATVAMMCKQAGKPVVCCCETYKFSDRIMLDSISGNEMGSPAPVFDSPASSDFEAETVNSALGISKPGFGSPVPSLAVFNLLYDVSRPEDVTVVISEAGLISSKSITAYLRDFKPLGQA